MLFTCNLFILEVVLNLCNNLQKQRDMNMEQTDAYLILNLLLQKRLLVMPYVELLDLLNTLESQGRITIEECNELLNLGNHLKSYDKVITE